MSAAHAIITDTAPKVALMSPLSDEDEDDDDICPVCESECTCHNRSNNAAPAPPRTISSTHSSNPSSSSSVPPTLKIKLTLPSNLKFRSNLDALQKPKTSDRPTPYVSESHHNDVAELPQHPVASGSGHLPSRRLGRPPKTNSHPHASTVSDTNQKVYVHGPSARPTLRPSAARAPAKPKRKVSGSAAFRGRGDGPRVRARGKAFLNAPRKSFAQMVAEDSDSLEEVSDIFPTFVSAASISSRRTSSSDSSSSDLTDLSDPSSDSDEDTLSARTRRQKTKSKQDMFNDDGSRKRRDQVNRWEIRTRTKSVGPDGKEGESGEASSEDDGVVAEGEDSDETDSDEDEDEAEGEADAENEGLMEVEEDEAELSGDGKLGVSFGGVAWSEDEEESSFDADLFFANLEGSSDSDSAPTPRLAAQVSDGDSDVDNTVSFSADEDDALFLMDVDPSTHVRRDHGGFEFGVALGGLSAAWDDPFAISYTVDKSDEEMSVDGSDDSDTVDDGMLEDSGAMLEETEGETTEDELVDANGLPNSRAMMLFKWPTTVSTVSTVDPLSTMSPRNHFSPPVDAPQSVRIALASFTAHSGSPLPTPAEILAGKISMDDYDEMDHKLYVRSKRAVMGEFVPVGEAATRAFAVVNGSGTEAASTPFPRTRVHRVPRSSAIDDISTTNDDNGSPIRRRTQQTTSDLQLVSSDDGGPHSQTQTSEASSADAIDLDDVLDAAFLGAESPTLSLGRLADYTPKFTATGDRMRDESLSRWDRIPVATFRQTRETATLDNAGSDTMNTPMGGRTLMNDTKAKGHSKASNRKHSKAHANKFIVSPVILPTPDGNVKTSSQATSASPPPLPKLEVSGVVVVAATAQFRRLRF
ncbi:hypothetical protein EUX98_g7760 [Antrodiella citrinella]|uniref:Uncharacterized protein n=1 Tax=Antrodiella citrinella TaxID=2447956 RepID=A0A4S4ML97_9APHY|nr:hypothetical protein EUX98_g7760 [Antrodiella citrinella]